MEDFREFYNTVGENYPEEEVVYRSLNGRLRKAFVLRTTAAWNGFFLDIGCNLGLYLKSYYGGRKVGVDLSFPILKRLRDQEKCLNLVTADAQSLECFRDGSFDCILCSEVLEHVPSPERAVKSIERLLKPGGVVLITTPNYRNRRPEWVDLGILRTYGIRGTRGDRYFHTAFRPEELEKLGKGAGLAVVESGTLEKEIRYANKIPALLFIALRKVNQVMFNSSRFERINLRLYEDLTLFVYRLAKTTGLDGCLQKWISEGVRSYVLLKKS